LLIPSIVFCLSVYLSVIQILYVVCTICACLRDQQILQHKTIDFFTWLKICFILDYYIIIFCCPSSMIFTLFFKKKPVIEWNKFWHEKISKLRLCQKTHKQKSQENENEQLEKSCIKFGDGEKFQNFLRKWNSILKEFRAQFSYCILYIFE